MFESPGGYVPEKEPDRAVTADAVHQSTGTYRPRRRDSAFLFGVIALSGEIVIALIVLFFSGAWGAIKFIDEKTDNKFVFFIPALFLSLFLYSGAGEGLLFYACLFAFGPIILMLVVVGIQQGKAPWRDDQNFNRGPRSDYSSQPRRPLNLNRELAPSYVRSMTG